MGGNGDKNHWIPNGSTAVVCAALLWSTGGIGIKLAPLPALAIVGGRAVVTVLFYLLFLRPNLRKASAFTSLAYAAMVISYVVATRMTTAASAVVLQYTGTAWILLLGPLMLGERLERRDGVTGMVCLAGMALCLLDDAQGPAITGNLIGALSGVFYAATVLGMRRDATSGRRYDAQASTTIGNILAAAIALPLAGADLSAVATPKAFAILLYLGLVQMGIAYLLFLRGLRSISAARASLFTLLEPALSPLWVALFIGEMPGPWTAAGGVIVIVALATSAMWPSSSKAIAQTG